MLISIEGVDGSGKNTVADGVAKRFEALRLDFPCEVESPTGWFARGYLRGTWRTVCCKEFQGFIDNGDPGPLVLQSLLTINKYEQLNLLRQHAGIHNPRHLVLARYTPSALVYGMLDGLDRQWLEAIHAGLPAADVNILVDVDADIAWERIKSRGKGRERYEQREKLERAVSAYRELWYEKQSAWMDPTKTLVGWYTVDGGTSIEFVTELAVSCVNHELSDAC